MRKVVLVCALVLVASSPGCRRRHPPVSLEVAPEPVAAAPAQDELVVPRHIPAPPLPEAVIADPVALGPRIVTELPDGGTANGDPRGPRAEALNQVVKGALPEMQRCLDGVEGVASGRDLELRIKYSIEPSGKASGVQVSGAVPPAGVACVQRTVEGMRFPEFGGPAVAGDFPFSYRRDVK